MTQEGPAREPGLLATRASRGVQQLGAWLLTWATGRSLAGAPLASTALALCVAAGADLAGPDASFTLLYLVPIGVATWFGSARVGIALSLLSAALSLLVEVSGRRVPLARAVVIWNLGVQLGVFLAFSALLAALKGRLEAEQRLARTDPLTGLSNRRAFLELASLEIERARRMSAPLTLAYVDADDFKDVNDRFGHAEGDRLLAAFAAALRSQTRSIDGVARLGGDEFGLLLVDTDAAAARVLVQRLRGVLASQTGPARVGFSVGAVTFLSAPRSVDEMLTHADQRMYEAKRAGKAQACFEVVEAGATRVA